MTWPNTFGLQSEELTFGAGNQVQSTIILAQSTDKCAEEKDVSSTFFKVLDNGKKAWLDSAAPANETARTNNGTPDGYAKAFTTAADDVSDTKRPESLSRSTTDNSNRPVLGIIPAGASRQHGHPNNSGNPASGDGQQASTGQGTSNQSTAANESSASVGGGGCGDGNGDDPNKGPPRPTVEDIGSGDSNDEEEDEEEQNNVPLTSRLGRIRPPNGAIEHDVRNRLCPTHPYDDGVNVQRIDGNHPVPSGLVSPHAEEKAECHTKAPSSDLPRSTGIAFPSYTDHFQDDVIGEQPNTRVMSKDPITHAPGTPRQCEVQQPTNECKEPTSDDRKEEIGDGGKGADDYILGGSRLEDPPSPRPLTHPGSYPEQPAQPNALLLGQPGLEGFLAPPGLNREEMEVDEARSNEEVLSKDHQQREVFLNPSKTSESRRTAASKATTAVSQSQGVLLPATGVVGYDLAEPTDDRTRKEPATAASEATQVATQSMVEQEPSSSAMHHKPGKQSFTELTDAKTPHDESAMTASVASTAATTQFQGNRQPGGREAHRGRVERSISEPKDGGKTRKEPAKSTAVSTTRSQRDLHPGSRSEHRGPEGSITNRTDDRMTHKVRATAPPPVVTSVATQSQGHPRPGGSVVRLDQGGPGVTKPKDDRKTRREPAKTASVAPADESQLSSSATHHRPREQSFTKPLEAASVAPTAKTQPASSAVTAVHYEVGQGSISEPTDDRTTPKKPAIEAATRSQSELQPGRSVVLHDHGEPSASKPPDGRTTHEEPAPVAATQSQVDPQPGRSAVLHDHEEEPRAAKPMDGSMTQEQPAPVATSAATQFTERPISVEGRGLGNPGSARGRTETRPDQEFFGNQDQHASKENVHVHRSLRPEDPDRPGTNVALPGSSASPRNPLIQQASGGPGPPGSVTPSAALSNMEQEQNEGGAMAVAHTTQSPATQRSVNSVNASYNPPWSGVRPERRCYGCYEECDAFICGRCSANEQNEVLVHAARERPHRVFFDPPLEWPDDMFRTVRLNMRTLMSCSGCPTEVWTIEALCCLACGRYFCHPACYWRHWCLRLPLRADRERPNRVFFDPPLEWHRVQFQIVRLNMRTLMRCFYCATEVWTMEAMYCRDCGRCFCHPECFQQHQCLMRFFDENDAEDY